MCACSTPDDELYWTVHSVVAVLCLGVVMLMLVLMTIVQVLVLVYMVKADSRKL